jgi:hypothetical protein
MITTNLQTVGVKVDMDDAIVLLDTWDAPLQKRLGSRPTSSVRIDWLEDDLCPDTFTVATSGVSGTSSPWTLTVDDTSWVRVGDLFTIDGRAYNIQFEVTSITDATTVVVAAFGATAASDDPVDDDVFRHVGQKLAEGADPGNLRAVDRVNPFNYTQIGQEGVQVSRTERKRATYGVDDEYTYQVQKKFKELAIRMERALTNGVRFQSGNKRTMGGLFSFITTNSESGTVSQAAAKLNSLVRDCFEHGGTPRSLYVSPAVKAAISANIDPTLRRYDRADRTGGYVIDAFQTDFGVIDVMVDRHFPTTKGLLLQEEFDTRRVFDGYFHEMLAKTGDGDKGEIVGEFSLEVKNEKAQGVLTLTDAS